MFSTDPTYVILRLLALLPALVLHEFAHGYSAWRLGDPTPKIQERLTLNPLKHLDPIGTLMIIFAPIGWAKPVQVNPYNFQNPERDFMISTLWGPLSNLIQGTFWAIVLRVLLALPIHNPATTEPNLLISFVYLAAIINFVLAFFNLIPLGPLDGHRILPYWLPYEQKAAYHKFNSQYGTAALLVLLALSFMTNIRLLQYIVIAPADFLVRLLGGVQ